MISIIVPVYNREKIILRTIQNLICQSFKDFEIIFVDDFSIDNTFKIIYEYSKKDSRVKCLRNPVNKGAQAARNFGINNAKGQWIAFQDSDDLWVDEKLLLQYKELEKVNFNLLTVVHSDCDVYYQNSGEKKKRELSTIEDKVTYRQLLKKSSVMFQSMLTSKRALQKIGFLDEGVPSFQEWDTAIRLSKICNFIHIRRALFLYNVHNGLTISGNLKNTFLGYNYIINKFKKDIIDFYGIAGWNNHLDILLQMCVNNELWKELEVVIKQMGLTKSQESILYLKKIFYKLLSKEWNQAFFLLKLLDHMKGLTLFQRIIKSTFYIYYKLKISPNYIFFFWSRMIKKKSLISKKSKIKE